MGMRREVRKGSIQFHTWVASELLVRDIELFLIFVKIFLELSDLVFYHTQLTKLEAIFLLMKK